MNGPTDSRDDPTAYNQHDRDEWVRQVATQLPAGSRVLDVGAGTARYRHLFARCDYRTHDFGEYIGTGTGELVETWEYPSLDYRSDITALPVDSNSFDVVLCTEVLEHVPRPIDALRELSRVVCPGGLVIVTAPLGSGLHQQPYHFYGGFTPHFYRLFMPEVGLEIDRIEPNGHFFRMLAQEVSRGGHILLAQGQWPPWHPARLFARVAAGSRLARWLVRIDDEIVVEEFTVGYHVLARKPATVE